VAPAEQLEAPQDGLVACAGEEERAAPAEDEAVGALAPERLGLAVGLGVPGVVAVKPTDITEPDLGLPEFAAG
jgi:hypothetical protein